VTHNVDYTGFIFYDKSKRYITPDDAATIVTKGSRGKHKKVGVFVNMDKSQLLDIVKTVNLDIVQLHGDESPAYTKDLPVPFWKVFRPKDETFIEQMKEYNADTFLLDTYTKDAYGGTGIQFDPHYARKAIETGCNIIIAGGISADVLQTVLSLEPFGIDVNSGIEDSPGIKNHIKISELSDLLKLYQQESL
jgi:phosphoribosylanthranilate isomerase